MEYQEQILEFLKTLKISFKNASIYNPDHPAFSQSLDDLHGKLESLLQDDSPLCFGFSPDSLMINGEFYEKDPLFRDLARMFHFRKLKSLEFLRGITREELHNFIVQAFSPLHEILTKGGMKAFPERDRSVHIQAEELDYSQLLKGEGEEIRDIWPFLLAEAVENPEPEAMRRIAASYDQVSREISPDAILADEELSENFSHFLDYLKENDEESFQTCIRRLIRSSLYKGKSGSETKLEKLKSFFTDLDEKDMAQTFWDEIMTDADFDQLSFSIFSRLMEKKRHNQVARSLTEIFEGNQSLKNNLKVREKIKNLLSLKPGIDVSEIYRRTLVSLLEKIEYKQQWTFDAAGLRRNYRYILLNMIASDPGESTFKKMAANLSEEWDRIRSDRDFEFVKLLYESLQSEPGGPRSQATREKLRSQITDYVEDAILRGETSLYLDYFIRTIDSSRKDINAYLSTIFDEGRVTPYILQAIFHFFTEYIFYFDINIDRNSSDIRLLEKIVLSLEHVDSPMSLVMLKSIFRIDSLPLRIKVLKAMQNLTESDTKFLLEVLKMKASPLRKAALTILVRDPGPCRDALDRLLAIQSIYGTRNRRIIRNISIISEGDFMEAAVHLTALTRRSGFWNRNVRESAQRVLERWNAGKD